MSEAEIIKRTRNGKIAFFCCETWRVYAYCPRADLIFYKNVEA